MSLLKECLPRIIYGLIASFLMAMVIIFILGVGSMLVAKHFLPFIIEVAVSGGILLLVLLIMIIIVITKQIQSCCEPDIECHPHPPPPPPIDTSTAKSGQLLS
jgi:hypothetical protein